MNDEHEHGRGPRLFTMKLFLVTAMYLHSIVLIIIFSKTKEIFAKTIVCTAQNVMLGNRKKRTSQKDRRSAILLLILYVLKTCDSNWLGAENKES